MIVLEDVIELAFAFSLIAIGFSYLAHRRNRAARQLYFRMERIQSWSGRAFDGAMVKHRINGSVASASFHEQSARRRFSRLAEVRRRISGLSFFRLLQATWKCGGGHRRA